MHMPTVVLTDVCVSPGNSYLEYHKHRSSYERTAMAINLDEVLKVRH